MGCSVGTASGDGKVSGCQSSAGSCASGGCNRMNVMDWFADMPISFNEAFNIVEVGFKNSSRKGFYRNTSAFGLQRGQMVVVEAAQGYDVGEVTLQGELVKLQMKKRKVTERDDTIRNIMRIADEHDIKTVAEVRAKENETMVRSRAIARSINLEMKIGDVEYQGDNKKVTIYYTADDRVDFRELVKVYAREFKVKIEMRQIGARQEAGRIGGIGTCGRELCCSTWLNDFKSVTTQTVRYQNLAINTDKLSGQCGRLKCCLNYELDTYNDALRNFPKHAEKIETEEGLAYLKKNEILKQQMWYQYETANTIFKLGIEDVKELLWMNKNGQKPKSLEDFALVEKEKIDESKHEDLVGQVSLSTLEEKERKNRRNRNNQSRNRNNPNRPNPNKQADANTDDKPVNTAGNRNNNRGNNSGGGNRGNNRGNNSGGGNRGSNNRGNNPNNKPRDNKGENPPKKD